MSRSPITQSTFARFVLVGTVATLTTYAFLVAGVEYLGMPAVLASVVGYGLGIVINYLLNYRFTFGSIERHAVVLPRFLLVMAIGMALNAGVMAVCVSGLRWHYLLAQLLAVAAVLGWSFTANRLWAFAPRLPVPDGMNEDQP